jgi:acetylornithine deacetylase/succinyl-diaminopimelate desuccinylase-like protein
MFLSALIFQKRVTTLHSISWTDVAREAADHLGHLLALGAPSPPAWELPAARYILNLFEREGITAFMLPSPGSGTIDLAPSRPNLVAHLPGSGAEEPLLLLSHLDGAPRGHGEWTLPHVSEGRMLYGAGALEGVHLTVAHAMALILLARRDVQPGRTIRFAATSDGAGGRASGLQFLIREHLEYITSDIALGWGGLSWIMPDGSPCALLTTAEKGVLHMKLRSEGGGGGVGIRIGKDPVEQLIRALQGIESIQFQPVISPASESLAESVADITDDPVLRNQIEGLNDPGTVEDSLKAIWNDGRMDPGLKALLHAAVSVEWGVVRLDATGGENLRPRVAEAELVYCYPQGEDVEALAIRVLEAIGPDGVYLSEKTNREPSQSESAPEIAAIARAAMSDIDPRAKLVTGLGPWPTGFGPLREMGTVICGWEPFASVGKGLVDVLKARGGAGEMIEMDDLVREVRSVYSFLCRIA